MPSIGAIKVRARLLVCLVAVVAIGCSSHIANSPFIKASLINHRYDFALKRIERIDKGGSRLLYLYEKGLVLHQAGSLEHSNAAFEEAEFLYDELHTKSVSREVGSLVTSDNVIKYRGEYYEIALIHYYKILNYLHLGDPQGALVECRKLNHRLQVFADDEDPLHARDPFLEYFTGMVYAAYGEHNDADVSFRVALEAYGDAAHSHGVEQPHYLYCDLVDSAERRHDREAMARYREHAYCDEHVQVPEGSGVLNLFIECGYAPYKTEDNIIMPLYKTELSDDIVAEDYAEVLYGRYRKPRNHELELAYLLRVAVPVMVAEPFPYADAEIRVTSGGRTHESYAAVVENVELLAFNAFEHRKRAILLKTIVRGLTKYLAKKGVEKKKGLVAGWLVNALNVATESADTRSWTTLPATIRMSRLTLPEGTYDVEIVLYDAFGFHEESFVIPQVKITRGRTKFLNYRIF
ncbi:MAG: hypothetical protein OEN01_05050 [Candidatus Krumholzibacteria bacterium]|nr:hypothetical protein [Candidatus Krumholzibacteria bacterium]